MKRFLTRFWLLPFLLVFCGTSLFAVTKPRQMTLKIIETTDVHGSIFPYDFIDGKTTTQSLAHVYTYVKQQRASGTPVILLDAGDILQGQPITNYYNYVKDPSKDDHIIADVMNFMKYDAGVVGNHDIEPGPAVYLPLKNKQFQFPWLSANTVDEKTGISAFQPYANIYRNGVKVTVLGLTTPKIPAWLPESVWKGYRFLDMIKTARLWVDYIRKHEQPDVLVGLFHAGFDYTYNGTKAWTPKNENASQLIAQEIPYFDAIFYGHDHRNKSQKINGVLMMAGKNAARSIAVATVSLKWDFNKGRYDVSTSGEVVSPQDYQADQELLNHFNDQFQEVKQWVSEEVGTNSETISSRDAMFGDSAFNDIIHELQFDVAKNVIGQAADISFAAPLQFDKTIKQGPIYVRDMYKLYKYENWLYLMKLTGKEVKDHLEYSYANWTNQMKDENDHLLNFVSYDETTGDFKLKTRYYNYDTAAGIVYTVDLTKPMGEKVTILGMDADLDGLVDYGSEFSLDKTYLAAVNSYRGGGGGGHLTSGAGIAKAQLEGRKVGMTARDLRFYLQEEIMKKGSISPRKINNWKFIPAGWADNGKAKDYPIIYKADSGAGH
jgi:2',3'-cyclic-nucleotide 2'-phosphodiesterase/3'-nucleotidase